MGRSLKKCILHLASFCIILSLVFSISLSIVNADSTVLYGDVNTDNAVNSKDYALLKRYLLSLDSGINMKASDLNVDGRINSTDYSILKRFLLEQITKLPVTSTPAVTGNVTYTLIKAANPTADQLDAYAKITEAMDSAIKYYNENTTIKKSINVYYEPSVSTADGNINGTIRFGSNRSYMVTATAMHEIAHTVGVGTSSKWKTLIVNGVYQGSNATAELGKITGKSDSVLKGDTQHFWPYGLNYASEVKSEADLINHCRIVEAMKKDGM